jgi:hypothetical protein
MQQSVSLTCICLCVTFLTNYLGNLFRSEYREKADEFKKELARAKESFDRSIRLETFEAIDGIGGFHVKTSDLRLS